MTVGTNDDDLELKKLGYEQKLHRGLNEFSNFAFGFTEVAVLASFTSQYGYGLATGGTVLSQDLISILLSTFIALLSRAGNYLLGLRGCVHHVHHRVVQYG